MFVKWRVIDSVVVVESHVRAGGIVLYRSEDILALEVEALGTWNMDHHDFVTLTVFNQLHI